MHYQVRCIRGSKRVGGGEAPAQPSDLPMRLQPVKRIEGRRVQCRKRIASMTSATFVQGSRLSSLLDEGGVNLIRNNLWGFEYFMIISWMFSSLQNLKRQHRVQDNVLSVDTTSISSLFQSLTRRCRTAMGAVADVLGLRV